MRPRMRKQQGRFAYVFDIIFYMERFSCPVSTAETTECPVFVKEGRCYEDIHHLQYPERTVRRMGKTAVKWRELDENKERRCRASHNEIHATQPLPELPTQAEIARIMRERLTN